MDFLWEVRTTGDTAENQRAPLSGAGVKQREQHRNLHTPLEKEMATHSSTLAWKIPRMEDPGRLQSMGLQRVGHD